MSLDPALYPGAAALLAVPQNCPSGDLLEGIDMLLLYRYPAPFPPSQPQLFSVSNFIFYNNFCFCLRSYEYPRHSGRCKRVRRVLIPTTILWLVLRTIADPDTLLNSLGGHTWA